jgi:hypothetical protein
MKVNTCGVNHENKHRRSLVPTDVGQYCDLVIEFPSNIRRELDDITVTNRYKYINIVTEHMLINLIKHDIPSITVNTRSPFVRARKVVR